MSEKQIQEDQDIQEQQCISKAAFFLESDECLYLISSFSSESQNQSSSSSSEEKEINIRMKCESLKKFRVILDTYLECPSLLDSKLEVMVNALTIQIQSILRDIFFEARSLQEDNDDDNDRKPDSVISDNISSITNHSAISFCLSALYTLCKVRGRKKVQKFLPHQVDDLEPLLYFLQSLATTTPMNNDTDDTNQTKIQNTIYKFSNKIHCENDHIPQIWEGQFVLMSWLEVLALLPFNLNTFSQNIKQNILDICNKHLQDIGPTRTSASSCLARLLTRPDLEQEGFLKDFISNYATNILNDDDDKENNINTKNTYLVMGVLETLVHCFKKGTQSMVDSIDPNLWELILKKAQKEQQKSSRSSFVIRKLWVKLFARIGMAFLKPRVADWRYSRGKRSLLENLNNTASASSQQTTQTARQQDEKEEEEKKMECHYTTQLPKNLSELQQIKDSSFFFEIPSQVEDVTSLLLGYLQDPSTIIRYTASKNLGRLTERLPQICSQDILDFIFHLSDEALAGDGEEGNVCNTTTENQRIATLHGTSLALAELARRGLLLPDRLNQSIHTLVTKAMQFDERKNKSMAIGGQVRDASCYACWAFSRAYSPIILKPYIQSLTESMVCVALFDREVNCRRAASAAFQEFVGRMGGNKYIKNGIEIIREADYYALGNREDAYCKVAFKVAKIGYSKVIMECLSGKLSHWDQDIRVLASQSLGIISVLEVEYSFVILKDLIKKATDKDLNIRHGAILGVAEITLSLGSKINDDLDNNSTSSMLQEIVNLVPNIEKLRLYRGRGGESVKKAACRLLECICQANLKLSAKSQVRYLDSIDAHLKHPNKQIQSAAVKALQNLTHNYFPVSDINGPSERLQNRIVNKYIDLVRESPNVAVTRGYVMGLGCLPRKLLAPNQKVLLEVLNCICEASNKQRIVGYEPDAETRRNAILSLKNIVLEVGINDSKCKSVSIKKDELEFAFTTLLNCMGDYSTDRRGDVGSWCRSAAMDALESISYAAIEASSIPNDIEKSVEMNIPCFFSEKTCIQVLSALLKQFSEKLDAVRSQAGSCLQRILLSKHFQSFPCISALVKALDLTNKNISDRNWANPNLTFPLAMNVVAEIPEFFEPVMAGKSFVL